MLVFFFEMNYLYLAKNVSAAKAFDGHIFLDSLIPLVPFFIIFYMAGYFFVLLPSFLLKSKKEFRAAYICFFITLSFSFLVFYFFPVFMNKQLATGSSFFSHLTKIQQKIDTNLNNFPSLHVSLNTISALIGFYYLKKYRYIVALFGALIAISTLLVKQHLFIDFIGGIIVAFSAFFLFKSLQKMSDKKFSFIYYVTFSSNLIFFYIMKDMFIKSFKVILKFIGKF